MHPKLPFSFGSIPSWAILGVGVVTGGIKSAWNFVYEHTIGFAINKVCLTVTVEDYENPEAYLWLSQWVETHLKTRGIHDLLLRKQRGRDVSHQSPVSSKKKHFDDEEEVYTLIPGFGTFYLRWRKRHLMVIDHWPLEAQGNGGGLSSVAKKTHSLSIKLWFTRDRSLLFEILEEAKQQYQSKLPDHLKLYRYSAYDGWSYTPIPPRPLDTTYFPQGMIDDLLADVNSFLSSELKYRTLGIPYRKGYQFDGPPGTGKSTLITALASHLSLPIYSMSLQSEGMDGERVSRALNLCAAPSIVVLEDIDCIHAAKERDASSDDRLTMSDLLNAIDGIGASEGRVLFMTANDPEKIDPALNRSGRVDRKYTITYSTDEDLRRFYDKVSELFPQPSWDEFRAALPEEATIADAQAYAFQGKNDHSVCG